MAFRYSVVTVEKLRYQFVVHVLELGSGGCQELLSVLEVDARHGPGKCQTGSGASTSVDSTKLLGGILWALVQNDRK